MDTLGGKRLKARGVFERTEEFGIVKKCFGGNASSIEAGPADSVFLYQGDFGPQL
jgi:hypothetical protein